MKKAFTLIELLTTVVILALIATIGIFAVNFILERSKMSSLNATAYSIQKSIATFGVNQKVKNGVNTYDLLAPIPAADYVKIKKDPWGNDYEEVYAYLIRNGKFVETNVFLKVKDKGCFYLIDGDSKIEDFDCNLDYTKNGLYTTFSKTPLEGKWHNTDVSFIVTGKLYINGLATKGGASHICYVNNGAGEICTPADREGRATVKITRNGTNNLNIYSKNVAGYSVDKDQQLVTIRIDKIIPDINISPNGKGLVCVDQNNSVATPVTITPTYGPSGGEYRYRWFNNGNAAAWTSYRTSSIITTISALGRRHLEVEVRNPAGAYKKYISGDYDLEGPIFSFDHTPSDVGFPYGGDKEVRISFSCTAGSSSVTNCGAKISNGIGTTGTYDNTSSPSLTVSKIMRVTREDVAPNQYLWMRGTTGRGCTTSGVEILRIFN